jgi:hypothetical protein
MRAGDDRAPAEVRRGRAGASVRDGPLMTRPSSDRPVTGSLPSAAGRSPAGLGWGEGDARAPAGARVPGRRASAWPAHRRRDDARVPGRHTDAGTTRECPAGTQTPGRRASARPAHRRQSDARVPGGRAGAWPARRTARDCRPEGLTGRSHSPGRSPSVPAGPTPSPTDPQAEVLATHPHRAALLATRGPRGRRSRHSWPSGSTFSPLAPVGAEVLATCSRRPERVAGLSAVSRPFRQPSS